MRKKIIISVIVVVLLAVCFFLWHRTQPKKAPAIYPGTSQQQGTTSKKATPHNANTPTSSVGQGGAVDSNGSSSAALPPKADWNVSSDGNITLQLPSSGDHISSGAQIVGLAKVDKVHFMLIDDAVGLLAQGELKAVNGKFAGQLSFASKGQTGRLDVYFPDPATGAEKSLVEIPVKF